MRFIRETGSLIGIGLRSLPRRLDVALVAIAGFLGVVLVFVSVLSIAQGFSRTVRATGVPGVALVLRKGAGAELSSNLTQSDAQIIGGEPGVRVGSKGPWISPELLVVISRMERHTRTESNVPLRGVTPMVFRLHPHIHLIAGRLFRPGLNEVIVGRSAAERFTGLGLGDHFESGHVVWHVVGIFTDQGGIHSSEIWADLPTLEGAFQRGDNFSSLYVALRKPDDYTRFRTAVEHDPRLTVQVEPEMRYFAKQAETLARFIDVAGTLILVLMGLGAIFAALNTMYAVVADRTREIATLRILGYGRTPILAAVLIESLFFALVGGALGSAVAYLGFNGYEASTLSNFSQIVFRFQVTVPLMATGMLDALILGLIGGLLPALRAARLAPAEAIRTL
ncbi:MAG: ABC transporter permease [Gammaproteobacteria bacterium]